MLFRSDRLVIVKVIEHHPAKPRPLSEVRDEINAAVAKEEGTKAARAAADAAVKRLKAGGNFDEIAKQLHTTATAPIFMDRGDPQPPAQIRDAAFAAPGAGPGKPVYQAIAMDQGGAAVLEVLAVRPGAAGANPANDQQLVASFAQRHSQSDFAAYLAEMQRRATVRRNPAILN